MERFYTLVTKIDYRISFEEQRKSWYIVYDIIQIIRWMKQNKIICPSYTMYVCICVKRVTEGRVLEQSPHRGSYLKRDSYINVQEDVQN